MVLHLNFLDLTHINSHPPFHRFPDGQSCYGYIQNESDEALDSHDKTSRNHFYNWIKKPFFLRLFTVLFLFFGIVVNIFSGETPLSHLQNRPYTKIAKPEKITVVDDISYAPFTFMDAKGKPRGITVDLWKLWSQKTGVKVEFQIMEWESALAAVQEGKADVVGGLFRTPLRETPF